MDPIALILAALAAGAEDTAAAPVRDAHAALMAQLRMRLADRAEGGAALAKYEESAPGWEAALGAELAAAGADEDEGLLTEAQAVMSVADAPGWRRVSTPFRRLAGTSARTGDGNAGGR